MDALSAMRLTVPPAIRGAGALQGAPDVAAPRTISPAELEKLGSGVNRTEGGKPFESVLSQLVQDVNSSQIAATDSVQGLLSGQNVSLHQTMISIEEASLSFQLMVEVRNKLLESYQELMRMQI